jgi:hypothetical protein
MGRGQQQREPRKRLGGALGVVVVAAFGGATAFLLNAASFVISALFAPGIRGRYRAEPSPDPAHPGIWAGVRFVARRHDYAPSRLTIA